MRAALLMLIAATFTAAAVAADAERACDQSDSRVVPAPQGPYAASIQHQVCETDAGGVAAAITVFVGELSAPLQGGRVLAIAVPRSHDEWPRAVWRGPRNLQLWIPNFAKVLETQTAWKDVAISLHYCHDDPGARARVAQHELDMKQWMQDVSRWAEARKSDAATAGPRPQRPEEPRVVNRPCSDADIPAGE
jgi:hypothetical protein